MNKYKGMYIVRPDLAEDQYKQAIEDMNKVIVDNGGEILGVDVWGMRDMAYEIKDFRKGYYVVFTANASPKALSEYDRICNIREDIIRHIIIKD